MAQARRKNSLNRTVLLPVDLIRRIEAEIASQHRHGREAPLTWSGWARRAFERDLEHGKRARVTRPGRKRRKP